MTKPEKELIGDAYVPVTLTEHDEKLKQLIEDFGLPRFDFPCPSCENRLGKLDVRAIGVSLNARFFGDVVMEMFCPECYSGFQYHLRRLCKEKADFFRLLLGGSVPEPVLGHTIPADESNLSAIILEDMK
tara:strand:+ start:77 stop:466 length:390 start_codon:yes stop_codon:yes gene_type:complete